VARQGARRRECHHCYASLGQRTAAQPKHHDSSRWDYALRKTMRRFQRIIVSAASEAPHAIGLAIAAREDNHRQLGIDPRR
jgi:hypothetical protein